MNAILAVDFGSTFTKVTAIREGGGVLATANARTTIETDIREGLNAALAELEALTGRLTFTHKLAASSAGGGLKMIAVGLVPSLTAKAAATAACSAGAKVIKTYAYELSAAEQNEIKEAAPDLVLLCGGTDGGNKDVILHNAKILAAVDASFAVIVAGNKSVADEVLAILAAGGKHAVACGNVMPVFNTLDTQPAKDAIGTLFMKKIIEAKGLAQAAAMMTMPIIPTPLAVFECVRLLAESLGDILAVDVGGATTDVYSMCSGAPTLPGITMKGLPEPFAKRTVEGDLGMRHSQEALLEALREVEAGAILGLDTYRAACLADFTYIPPKQSEHNKIDQALCALAVDIAVTRHAGRLESAYTPFGQAFYQLGKDLTAVKHIIGIGGPIIYSNDPYAILQRATSSAQGGFVDQGGAVTQSGAVTQGESATPGGTIAQAGSVTQAVCPHKTGEPLKPANARFLLDKKYIFAAMGLLARVDKKLALQILESEL